MNQKIIVAIDGFSACGKSTLAKDIAINLKYGYIDTGAMYRCCTLYLLQQKIPFTDIRAIENHLPKIKISFKNINGKNTSFLNNIDVTEAIREMEVSKHVSQVAAIPQIRKAMVRQQQETAKKGGFVLDGRDIGSVVFPNAKVKLFITASIKTRSYRRFLELKNKGKEIPILEIEENLISRDNIDSNRQDSPLIMADDAVLIDNSNLSKKEQLAIVLALINTRILGMK